MEKYADKRSFKERSVLLMYCKLLTANLNFPEETIRNKIESLSLEEKKLFDSAEKEFDSPSTMSLWPFQKSSKVSPTDLTLLITVLVVTKKSKQSSTRHPLLSEEYEYGYHMRRIVNCFKAIISVTNVGVEKTK